MKKLSHNDLRNRFLDFFAKRDHLILPSSPLVPENDKSTLFTTAGVQPLIPYLKSAAQPPALRIANSQKCLRTNDIEEVGDNSHLTFFEMLGSWSIGDYNKVQAIKYAHDFLTSEQGLNIPKERLWVTVFKGDENLPKDEVAFSAWRDLEIPSDRIVYLSEKDNWWQIGPEGLCGPDTEVFYDLKWPEPVPEGQNPGNDPTSRFVEIWNTVFMSYDRKQGQLNSLPSENIDEGAGLERMLSVINCENIYDTSCFKESMNFLRGSLKNPLQDEVCLKIIADHMRTILFILSEEPRIYPSAAEQGYILRKLIRSAINQSKKADFLNDVFEEVLRINARLYQDFYPEVAKDLDIKIGIFKTEQAKFEKIIQRAPKVWSQFTKAASDSDFISPITVFRMVTEQGIPIDVIEDLARQHNKVIDKTGFDSLMQDHKKISRDPNPEI